METLLKIIRMNQRRWVEIKTLFIRVAFLGFLDLIFRFSYTYLGWLSYVVRLVGLICPFIVPVLPYNALKFIFRYMAVFCYIVLAWILTSLIMTKGETMEWSPLFIILLKLGQFCSILTYYYTCNVITVYRFLFHTYIFFVGGSILQICPSWISYTFIIVSVCLAAKFSYRLYKNDICISEEQDMQMTAFFDSVENMQVDDLSKALIRKEFVIYFSLLFSITFTLNAMTINSSLDIDQWYWISTSTLGMCCSTIISVNVFVSFVTFISKQTIKISYYLMKGESIVNTELLFVLDLATMIGVYLSTFDLFMYNMEPFERGLVMSGRIIYLIGSILEANSVILQTICLEPNMIRGNKPKILRVVGMHLFFGISSLLILYKILEVYSMLDLGIMLTTSIFFNNVIRTVFSLFIFWLYRIDIMRQEGWETFDDVVFNTKLTQLITHISLHVGTALYGVWTLYAGVYLWVDINRLFCLCYINIYTGIKLMKNDIKHRKQVVQFLSQLDDASNIQVQRYEDKCPICLLEMTQAKVTPCRHMFHEVCLKKWLNSALTCPMCKADIKIELKRA